MQYTCLDDYCVMDDSTQLLTMRNLPEIPYTLEFYVSSLILPHNETASLVILKPKEISHKQICKEPLETFLNRYVGSSNLIACQHYDKYPSLFKERKVKFFSKGNKDQYPSLIRNKYKLAHLTCHEVAHFAKKLLTNNYEYKKNRERIVEAIRQKDTHLNLGLEFTLLGLYLEHLEDISNVPIQAEIYNKRPLKKQKRKKRHYHNKKR